MGVVLPREPDAAEHLHTVLRTLEERVRHERARDRGRQHMFLVGVGGTCRVPRNRARLLEGEQHVGAPVLHALELADRPAELLAHLRVLRGRLDAPRGATRRLRGQEDDREIGDRAPVRVG